MVSAILKIEPPPDIDRQAQLDEGVHCATGWGAEEVAGALLDDGADPAEAFYMALARAQEVLALGLARRNRRYRRLRLPEIQEMMS